MTRASVSLKHKIGLLKEEPHLLTASFEINGSLYPVLVDTGANISILPEKGSILAKVTEKFTPASLNVKLADNGISHINKKIRMQIRPKGSTEHPVSIPFYVINGATKVVDHEALFGLNALKEFDLRIDIQNGRISVHHRNRIIGSESTYSPYTTSIVKIDNRIEGIHEDSELSAILKRYRSVFTDLTPEPMRTKPMRFLTVHNRPVYCKTKHYDSEQVEQMRKQIDELLSKGIIEPTYSGYSANTRIVPKKNGQGRLVVNYIPLNRVTLRDSYTLPHVSDILNAVQGNKVFSTLDCQQGFHQILVDQRDRHKTAFSTPFGNFQYVRCPFGARNSPAQFQREMNIIFREGLYRKCVIYVDDILVMGKSKPEHDSNLAWVLSKCQEFNVKLKLEKCNFAKTKVEYLGYEITGTSIEPLQTKLDTLIQSNAPKNKTELRSLIGKLNFYARFIKEYSKHVEPLRELFRKNQDFQWRPHHQKALEDLICSLKEAKPQKLVGILEHKIIELHIIGDSIEALLLTKDEELICRTSRLLANSESNYSIVEKYLLALVTAMEKFRIWLHPDHLTIRLPTNELEKAMKLVHKPQRLENLLLRMPEGFDEFQFEIKGEAAKQDQKRVKDHVPQEIYYVDGACRRNGKLDCIASWAVCAQFDKNLELTGYITENPSNNSAEITAAIKACEYAKQIGQDEITIVTDSKYLHSAATNWICKWQSNEWQDHKRKPIVNTDLFKLLLYAKDGLRIDWIHVRGHTDSIGNNRADALARSLLDNQAAKLCAIATYPVDIQAGSDEILKLISWIEREKPSNYEVINGTVYYIDSKLDDEEFRRVFVPTDARAYLMNLAHDDPYHGGHLGIRKTYRKLIRFWWPQIYKEVEQYVKSCTICQRFKNPKGLPIGYLHSVPVSEIFEHLHIDVVGPLKRTYQGNAYIITATDAFSKWVFARPVQQATTDVIIDFVKEAIISIHGTPKVFRSDQGPQFTSYQWKEFLNQIGATHSVTCPYSPQANGIDERVNGTLVRILKTNLNEHQEDWDKNLIWAVKVYNNTVHESTGFSPYQVIYARDPRTPLREINRTSEQNLHIISAEDIRKQVRKNNERAQTHQRDNYNSKRRQFHFKVGEFVYIRNHTVPSDLTKKFYPIWYGPVIISSLIGDDQSNPTAVRIYDCKQNRTKTVSVRDLKAHRSRLEAPTEPTLVDFSTQNNDNSKTVNSDYFIEPSQFSILEPNAGEQTALHNEQRNATRDHTPAADKNIGHDVRSHDNQTQQPDETNLITFDVIESNEEGQPISSSPLNTPQKHVRFNGDVQVRELSTVNEDSIEITDNAQNTEDNDVTLVQAKQLPQRQAKITSQPSNLVEQSPYFCPNQIDNVRKDPTYIQPQSYNNRSTKTSRVDKSPVDQNIQVSSHDNGNSLLVPTHSLIPRYNLRRLPQRNFAYNTQSETQKEKVEEQAPSRDINQTDLSVDNTFISARTGDTMTENNDTISEDTATFIIERDAPVSHIEPKETTNRFGAALRSILKTLRT